MGLCSIGEKNEASLTLTVPVGHRRHSWTVPLTSQARHLLRHPPADTWAEEEKGYSVWPCLTFTHMMPLCAQVTCSRQPSAHTWPRPASVATRPYGKSAEMPVVEPVGVVSLSILLHMFLRGRQRSMGEMQRVIHHARFR